MPIEIATPSVGSLPSLVAEQARVDREDPPLSQKDAAQFLGVSVSTLIRWKSDGVAPKSFKIGGRVKYRLSALRAFITQCEADSRVGETGDE